MNAQGQGFNLEGLLRDALAPVEPPRGLEERLESTLDTIAQAAADELADWEIDAMRGPRDWVKPATAVVAGSVAGTALYLMRSRSRSRGRDVPEVLRELGEVGRKAAHHGLKLAAEAGRDLRETAEDARSRLR